MPSQRYRPLLCGLNHSSPCSFSEHDGCEPTSTLLPFFDFLRTGHRENGRIKEEGRKQKGKTDKAGVVCWGLVRKKYICKLLWVLRWPSPSLPGTGRSKRMRGTERAASCGLEDGQMWWVASVPGTKTSCRIRPCLWGSEKKKKKNIFLL